MSAEHDQVIAALNDLAAENGTLVGVVQQSVLLLDAAVAKINSGTPEDFSDALNLIAAVKAAQVAAVTQAESDPNYSSSSPVASSPQ